MKFDVQILSICTKSRCSEFKVKVQGQYCRTETHPHGRRFPVDVILTRNITFDKIQEGSLEEVICTA